MLIATSVVNKIVLARHLFNLALDGLKSQRDIALFGTVNLMQDSVEAYLLAISEHVNAGIDNNTSFDKYFSKIEEKITPKLPFRSRIIALNKLRVAVKHYGIKPDRAEVNQFALVCREFFNETCMVIFGIKFWSISLVEILDDGEIKETLKEAQNHFESGRWLDCMIACRKFLFLEFEQYYDIERFKDGREKAGFFGFTYAPFFATEKKYIDEHVLTPFDYIVFDNQKLESQLMVDGIDVQVFWNMWRLTPAVYRFRKNFVYEGGWLVKRELRKEEGANEENAAYVLEHSIDMAVHLSQRKQLVRNTQRRDFYIELKRDSVKIFEKADRNSPVVFVTEPGRRKLDVEYSTTGLDRNGVYWYVSHLEPGGGVPKFRYISGFVHEDDVDWSEPQEPELPLSSIEDGQEK